MTYENLKVRAVALLDKHKEFTGLQGLQQELVAALICEFTGEIVIEELHDLVKKVVS